MKKLFTKMLALTAFFALFAGGANAQTELRFTSSAAVATYTFSTGDKLHALSGNFSSSSSGVCHTGSTYRIQANTVILELVSTTMSEITFYGKSSGSSPRVVKEVSVSDTQTGEYIVINANDYTMNSTITGADCNNIKVSGLNIEQGKFVKFVFAEKITSGSAGNVQISAIDIVAAGPIVKKPAISKFVVIGEEATIDDENGTITIELPNGTDITAITPAVTLNTDATSYTPTEAKDFTGSKETPIVYTVFSEDMEQSKAYNVTITTAEFISNDATLSDLQIDEVTVEGFDPEVLTYSKNYAYSAEPTYPIVSATKNNAAATVAEIEQITSFPGTVNVIVTAQDGISSKTYTINFTQTPASDQKNITKFELNNYSGVISENEITVTMHNGTVSADDIKNLTPAVKISNFATADFSEAKDFTSPVTYTVMAQDGTTKEYTVNVVLADLTYNGPYPYETDIPATDFEMPTFVSGILTYNNAYTGSDASLWYNDETETTNATASVVRIDNANGEVEFFLSRCSKFEIGLSATGGRTFNLLVNGAKVATSGQVTSKTKVVLSHEVNSNDPVIVTVQNVGTGGATIGSIKIEGVEILSDAKDITAFSINDVDGVIEGTAISVELINDGTLDITNLTPVVTVSDKATYSPQGAQDFTNAVTYTVTAENSTTKDYTVTVTIVTLSDAKDITAFSINDVAGVIEGTAITVTLDDDGTLDITNLTPAVTVSDKATYSPQGAQDFTNAVTYTVTAEDLSTKDYTVTVVVNPVVGVKGHTIDGVTFDGKTISNTDNKLIQVFDINGRMVVQSIESSIDLSNQVQGVYMIKSEKQAIKIAIAK